MLATKNRLTTRGHQWSVQHSQELQEQKISQKGAGQGGGGENRVQSWKNYPLTLTEIFVWLYIFDNNFWIENDFTKYLKESCW